jgi:hypothetical protein
MVATVQETFWSVTLACFLHVQLYLKLLFKERMKQVVFMPRSCFMQILVEQPSIFVGMAFIFRLYKLSYD